MQAMISTSHDESAPYATHMNQMLQKCIFSPLQMPARRTPALSAAIQLSPNNTEESRLASLQSATVLAAK
jgi:hypothetical protein